MSGADVQRPFELLTNIAQRYSDSTIAVPGEDTQQDDWRGVGFTLAGQHFVAPLAEVDEILYIPECTKVPGVKSWINGVANVRGRLLSVIDLGLFFGGEPSIASRTSRVLAVQHGDLYSGVIVDRVLGMQNFVQSSFTSKAETPDILTPYVNGAFKRDDQCWSIFRLSELVKSPSFLQVAV